MVSRFTRFRGLSVSAKISLGFSIVLILHISIAALGHYGLRKADADRLRSSAMHRQVETFDEIDRVVGGLQRNVLLFAFSGYHGPEVRAAELQDKLDKLLRDAAAFSPLDDDRESLEQMRRHLEVHREIFENVVVDRAHRRKLVNEDLARFGKKFSRQIRELAGAMDAAEGVSAADAAFQAAQLDAMQFVNDPDSAHVRGAKQHLARATGLLSQWTEDASPETADRARETLQTVSGYEAAFIQMVQATRGYLHLVNVVLAGETEECRRLAHEIRTQQSERVRQLAASMARDSSRFQLASNVFSVVTILLGVLAAWRIGHDVAPALNAITSTFDGLTRGESCQNIPGLDRRDELGRLAAAAQVFKDKAADTERLLRIAETTHRELEEVNRELARQTELANSMVEEATAATLAKSEFLANMSHEIRTPMTAILGFSEALAESADDEEQVKAINTIRRNGEHLLGIINDILDLSKVEAGRMTVELLPYSPCKIIAEVVALMAVKADGAGLALQAEYEGSVPEAIRTDPSRLRQILINLIGNAIKFTEVGGVRLIVRFVDEAPQPTLQFDVVDTGIGLTPEQVAGLFRPFSQADSSTTRKFGGTGLGLTISKRLAEILGGDIRVVQTARGEGSRFRLTVATGPLEGVEMLHHPMAATHLSEEPPQRGFATHQPQADNALQGRAVLLAEDGPDNQRLIAFVLKKAGADVTVQENGQLALECALAARDRGRPFDCVLMDMQMPVLDGYRATRALRREGYRGAIVALTAHAMDSDRQKCLDAGCDDFLTKPLERVHLVATVQAWCGRTASPELQES